MAAQRGIHHISYVTTKFAMLVRGILAAGILFLLVGGTATAAGVVGIAAGAGHMVALKNDGTVWAWGSNNHGQAGDGTTTDCLAPVQVLGLSGASAIAAGAYHSVALKSDGMVWAWGYNSSGQVGDGTTTDRHTPFQVTGLSGVEAITAGWYYTAALKSDGTVWAWGDNDWGQLGDGTTTQRNAPVQALINSVSFTTTLSGTGGGSVNSSPAGITCPSGPCTDLFLPGTLLTLLAAPDSNSIFAGWSGGGCSGGGECAVTVAGDTVVYAQFTYVDPARILGGNYYTTLSAAYAAAKNGDTIQARVFSFTESLDVNQPSVTIALNGGFDTSYNPNFGVTTLAGSLTVSRGSVTVGNLVIK